MTTQHNWQEKDRGVWCNTLNFTVQRVNRRLSNILIGFDGAEMDNLFRLDWFVQHAKPLNPFRVGDIVRTGDHMYAVEEVKGMHLRFSANGWWHLGDGFELVARKGEVYK